MCDACTFCGKPGFHVALRLTATNELICHDCHDDGHCEGDACDWHDLLTPDELAAQHEAKMDDRAHALRERRMGL